MTEHEINHRLVRSWQKERNHESVAKLYKRCERFVNYLVHRRLRSFTQVDVESIANQAFYIALCKFKTEKATNSCHFIGFMQRVCVHLVLAESRKKFYHSKRISDDFDVPAKPPKDYEIQDFEHIYLMLAEYTKNKDIIEYVKMRFEDGMSIKEIAEKCGKKKQWVSRCILKCLGEIKGENYELELI